MNYEDCVPKPYEVQAVQANIVNWSTNALAEALAFRENQVHKLERENFRLRQEIEQLKKGADPPGRL